NMPACFGGLLNHDRHARRAFLQRRARAVPGERPTPVETDFVMRIDNVIRAKLMPENFGAILCDRDGEVLSLLCPVSVTHPERVLTIARDLEILIQRRAILVGARSGRVPFTLTALRPLG